MKQSQLCGKTIKESPRDEESKNAQLLIRAGYIKKEAAGIYSLLPLGLRVIRNLEHIIREEMNALGGQEVLMPALIPKKNMTTSERWDSIDVLFKIAASDKKEYALGATHEEIVTPLLATHILSHKDLPCAVYQIQNKFRNEKRAKAGLLRLREFLMKDLYSFHTSEEDLDEFYDRSKDAYTRIFERAGIGHRTFLTFASGGIFTKFSHEYQSITPAGEDTIFVCETCSIAINEEVIKDQSTCPQCDGTEFTEERAIEVGNIFKLKDRFSKAFKLTFKDSDETDNIVHMGCYGIGIQRLMGSIVEILGDENGLVWPKEVAPFQVHLIGLNTENKEIEATTTKLYATLQKKGISVLLDDRTDKSVGQRLNDADLMGIPTRVVISEKTLAQKGIEVKNRASGKIEITTEKALMDMLSQ